MYAININNIIHHKDVTKSIPAYFKHQSAPKISYAYTRPIASNIFNYKLSLQDWRFTNHDVHTPSCFCSSSQFLYSPAGYIVSGDLNIIQNQLLRDLIYKGPTYREPNSFSWRYNF